MATTAGSSVDWLSTNVTVGALQANQIVCNSFLLNGAAAATEAQLQENPVASVLNLTFDNTLNATALQVPDNGVLVVKNRMYQNLTPNGQTNNDHNGFVALAKQSAPQTSYQNGIKCVETWNQTQAAQNLGGWRDIEWASEKDVFVAVSGARTAANGGCGPYLLPPGTTNIQWSKDGLVWNNVTWKLGSPGAPEGNVWFTVKYAPALGRFAAVAKTRATTVNTSHFAYSDDGKEWTMLPYNAALDGPGATFDTQNTWAGLAWSGTLGKFVCVSNNNLCTLSSDGITWRVSTSSVVAPVLDCLPTNPTAPSDNLVPQFDTLAWASEIGLFVTPIYVYTRVGTTDPLLLPPGNQVAVSADGFTWTSITLNSVLHGAWKAITWSPELGLLVAVSEQPADAVNGCQVMYSYNGMNWTGVPLSQTRGTEINQRYRCITWAPEYGMFVSCGFSNLGKKLLYSFDGLTWTLDSNALLAPFQVRNIVYSRELCDFILCADSGPTLTIASISNSGGLIRVTTVGNHPLVTGDTVDICSALPATNANGQWVVTVTGLTTFTLNGSVFAAAQTTPQGAVTQVLRGGFMFNSSNVYKLPGPRNVFNACFNKTDEGGSWGMGSGGGATMGATGGIVDKKSGYFCIPAGGLGANTLPTNIAPTPLAQRLELGNGLNVGYAPMFYDTGANKLYIFNYTSNAWKSTSFA